MRIPLSLLTLPVLAIAVFGTFVSPDSVIQLFDHLAVRAPLTIRLQSIVPYVVGNRPVGEIAVTCLTLLAVKQCIDYFEKS